MAHGLGALRVFSALTQKHGGKSDRGEWAGSRTVGGRWCRSPPANRGGESTRGGGQTATGRKLQRYGGTPGTGNGAQTATGTATRCIKYRAALRGGCGVAVCFENACRCEFI